MRSNSLYAECGWLRDATVDAGQRAADELQRHERVRRKRRFESASELRGESKPGIVARIAQDEDRVFAARGQRVEAEAYQTGSDALALTIRMDGERRERRGRVCVAASIDEDSTEQHVADDALVDDGDEGGDHGAFATQRLNQIRLGRPSKCRLHDGSNGIGVVVTFPSQ